jgi:hypothetical protein
MASSTRPPRQPVPGSGPRTDEPFDCAVGPFLSPEERRACLTPEEQRAIAFLKKQKLMAKDMLYEARRTESSGTPDRLQPLSARSRAELEVGIRSAKVEPSVYLGSFAQYADDDE